MLYSAPNQASGVEAGIQIGRRGKGEAMPSKPQEHRGNQPSDRSESIRSLRHKPEYSRTGERDRQAKETEVSRRLRDYFLRAKIGCSALAAKIIFFLCQHFGVKVTILYEIELKELMEQYGSDVIEIITVFSSKIYVLRAHSNRKNSRKPKAIDFAN